MDRNTIPEGQNEHSFSSFLQHYYLEKLKYFPLEATENGISGYDNLLTLEYTDSFRIHWREFLNEQLSLLHQFDLSCLTLEDKISYDILERELHQSLNGLSFHDNYFPFNQFDGILINMTIMGSGSGSQPFSCYQSYLDWIERVIKFSDWINGCIDYFRNGIDAGWTLPEVLVRRMIPQIAQMAEKDLKKNLFMHPFMNFPDAVDLRQRQQLVRQFKALMIQQLLPALHKLLEFLKLEYLAVARKTDGLYALPNGLEYYNYLIGYWTSTSLSADTIYNIGIEQVDKITLEMEKVKKSVGFQGSLSAFFTYLRTDPRFRPYKSAEEILEAFHAINDKVHFGVNAMFLHKPTIPFEIRQTEAFRAESASAEYMPGAADGSRPAVFYIPILDPTQFNVTSGMESLFLHEAIPGHHYQVSLQMENKKLPMFRKYLWIGAYGEGYALYAESLGKELGLYQDPFQYMGSLGDAIHRAIRLVVDTAIHTGKMNRKEAIAYMMEHEACSEQYAQAEIERYMALPAQALSYKIGEMVIRDCRNLAEQKLGSKFVLSEFHDQLLKEGCLPLNLLRKMISEWIEEKNRTH